MRWDGFFSNLAIEMRLLGALSEQISLIQASLAAVRRGVLMLKAPKKRKIKRTACSAATGLFKGYILGPSLPPLTDPLV